MSISKTGEDASMHRTEDVMHDSETDPKQLSASGNAKVGDRAAELIGSQHIEVTEEDVRASL